MRVPAFLLLLELTLSACALVPDRRPLPVALKDEATILGIRYARFFADEMPELWARRFREWTKEEAAKRLPALFGRPHYYLAISGGSLNGAFGAGLLKGWTEHGDRPEFSIVTGISTGALIAPFAFLGPEYDPVLEEIYTRYGTKDIFIFRPLVEAFFSDSVIGTRKFERLIARYITDEVVARIAEEHRRGRRLWIGTTDLDTARPVLWDIGRIAASGKPGARALIQKVLKASASIPSVFPPVYFEFEVNGRRYDEIHVDGGATSQVFLYPVAVDWRRVLEALEVPGKPEVYIIRNSRLTPPARPINPADLFTIAQRTVNALVRTQGIGDLYAIYYVVTRDGLNYNLAYIPDSFELEPEEPFDRDYMRRLFALGYRLGREGYRWHHLPPGIQEEQERILESASMAF